MKSNNKLLYRILAFFILSPITIYLIIFFSKTQTLNEEFNGIVIEISFDGHDNMRIVFENNSENINLMHFSADSTDDIKIGDSLYKKKGSLIL